MHFRKASSQLQYWNNVTKCQKTEQIATAAQTHSDLFRLLSDLYTRAGYKASLFVGQGAASLLTDPYKN